MAKDRWYGWNGRRELWYTWNGRWHTMKAALRWLSLTLVLAPRGWLTYVSTSRGTVCIQHLRRQRSHRFRCSLWPRYEEAE